jgi:AcrR family transcriptional regulator
MKPKALERKESILQAATELFYQSGYRNTDVQQIADQIAVGKGTIYRYFVSKEDLFFAAVDRAMLKMEEFVHDKIKSEKDDISRIKLAIQSYVGFFRKHPEFIELFVQERAEFRLRDVSSYLAHRAKRDGEWAACFQRLFVEGKVRYQKFDLICDFISNFLYGIMFTKVFQLDNTALLHRSEEGLDMVLYGILVQNNNQ